MANSLGIDGLASGLKTSDLIQQMMETQRKPLNLLQQKKTDLKTKSDAWRDVNTRLLNLKNTVNDLQSSLTFNSRKVNVSNTDILTATASNGSAQASYNIEVLTLAKAHTITSDSKASASTSLNYSGTIKVNGKNIEITSIDTLNSIADKINTTDGVDVAASVVQIGANNYKLTLTSKKTGAENAISLVDDGEILTNLGIFDASDQIKNQIQAGANASVKINGLTVERSTNTMNDAIQGVVLNLKTAKPGTELSINVETDIDKVTAAVRKFVDQYNSTMNYIEDNLAYDTKTKIKGKLFGDSSLQSMQSQLRRFVSRTVSGVDQSVNQLSLVGISTGKPGSSIDSAKEGDLVLDESVLREKLKDHFNDVAKLFGAAVTNVAASKNGGAITASSQFSASFPVTSIIDGRTSSADWSQGGGWNDATSSDFPDWVELNLSRKTSIDQIKLYTLDSSTLPAATYGIKDYSLEYWDSATNSWNNIKTVTGNTKGMISEEFSAVVTDKVRVNIAASNGANDFSRLVEVEVYEQNNGVFSGMYDSLYEWTRADGVNAKRQDVFGDQLDDLDDRIEAMEDRLAGKEEYYYKKFTAMEQALQKLQSQSSWLSAQMSAMESAKSK